eukprot:SRR837773.10430.p2 GENE.SRR837773.10430~~SRR837773.10430.p2  ORF type:complete len:140 (-),score=42.77 SRR837773.10430:39-404(-)
MGEEVRLKLIFANDPSQAELAVPMSTAVKDLKKRILSECWPESMPAMDTVDRLRLFASGREIGGKGAEDSKCLTESKFLQQQDKTVPTPVHVQPVLRSSEPASAERETASSKSPTCTCAIL